MNELTRIEREIQKSCEQELMQIVDGFILNMEILRNKYGHRSPVFYYADPSIDTEVITEKQVKDHLMYMLKDKYLDPMILRKTNELLKSIKEI